jgi:hypothetical protein
MAKVYAQLDDRLTKFILAQPIFFVATAPCLSAEGEGGHVNVSPKGYRDTFAIIGPRTVAYLDLTGSGAETIAHLRQNGRITLMFCSFDRSPKILRLYGTGRVVLPPDQDWPRLAAYFGGADHAADARPANGHGANHLGVDSRSADGHGADARSAYALEALLDERLSWPKVGEVTLRLAAAVVENHGVLVTLYPSSRTFRLFAMVPL